MDYQRWLRIALYALAIDVAAIAELLMKGGVAGVIASLAIYLPAHNHFWGRV